MKKTTPAVGYVRMSSGMQEASPTAAITRKEPEP